MQDIPSQPSNTSSLSSTTASAARAALNVLLEKLFSKKVDYTRSLRKQLVQHCLDSGSDQKTSSKDDVSLCPQDTATLCAVNRVVKTLEHLHAESEHWQSECLRIRYFLVSFLKKWLDPNTISYSRCVQRLVGLATHELASYCLELSPTDLLEQTQTTPNLFILFHKLHYWQTLFSCAEAGYCDAPFAADFEPETAHANCKQLGERAWRTESNPPRETTLVFFSTWLGSLDRLPTLEQFSQLSHAEKSWTATIVMQLLYDSRDSLNRVHEEWLCILHEYLVRAIPRHGNVLKEWKDSCLVDALFLLTRIDLFEPLFLSTILFNVLQIWNRYSLLPFLLSTFVHDEFCRAWPSPQETGILPTNVLRARQHLENFLTDVLPSELEGCLQYSENSDGFEGRGMWYLILNNIDWRSIMTVHLQNEQWSCLSSQSKFPFLQSLCRIAHGIEKQAIRQNSLVRLPIHVRVLAFVHKYQPSYNQAVCLWYFLDREERMTKQPFFELFAILVTMDARIVYDLLLDCGVACSKNFSGMLRLLWDVYETRYPKPEYLVRKYEREDDETDDSRQNRIEFEILFPNAQLLQRAAEWICLCMESSQESVLIKFSSIQRYSKFWKQAFRACGERWEALLLGSFFEFDESPWACSRFLAADDVYNLYNNMRACISAFRTNQADAVEPIQNLVAWLTQYHTPPGTRNFVGVFFSILLADTKEETTKFLAAATGSVFVPPPSSAQPLASTTTTTPQGMLAVLKCLFTKIFIFIFHNQDEQIQAAFSDLYQIYTLKKEEQKEEDAKDLSWLAKRRALARMES